MIPKPDKDFFISYTQADRRWAEWLAWELEEAKYRVIIQDWDFEPGVNFVERMDTELKESGRTLLILTPDALGSRYVREEWTAALIHGRLAPVRVVECDPEGLLGTRAYIDLVGFEEDKAIERLLSGLQEGRAKPDQPPEFPGAVAQSEHSGHQRPDFPGALPPFWNVPHSRNRAFTGRETLLNELHESLHSGEVTALTQAIAGLGGVGKTQLALEYSYRHAHEYGGVWWLRAETPETLVADYAALADSAGLPERESVDREVTVEAVRLWLGRQEHVWLLVFDNAAGPDSVRSYLPNRAFHHVLVTSRNLAFRDVANPLEVQTFEREESMAFLVARTGSKEQEAATALADQLGDLPLALAQAAAYVDTVGLSLSEYLARYRNHRAALLACGITNADYPNTVATTWSLAFEAVKSASPAGTKLLQVLSFLAPEKIPRWLILDHPNVLPVELAQAVENILVLDEAVAALRRHSLLETTGDSWLVHRLVQAITRDRLHEQAADWAEVAVNIVNDAFPYQRVDTTTWGPSEALLPHALASAEHALHHGVGLQAAARVLNQAGLYMKNRAQLPEARSALERALGIDEQVFGPEHPEVATDANNIGQILLAQGDLEGALRYTRRALEVFKASLGTDHPSEATASGNLGQILLAQGDLNEALHYAKRALHIDELVYGLEHPSVAIRANNIGTILKAQGDLDGALHCAKRALDIDELAYGPEHPSVAIRANNFGTILQAQGDLEGALRYTQRALRIGEKVYGPTHPTVAAFANNVGQVLKDQGDFEGALRYTQHAIEIDEHLYGPEHPRVATDCNNIGQILLCQGDLDQALTYALRALAIDQQTYGSEHPDVARDANNIGTILKAQGELESAGRYAQQALEIFLATLGPDHPNTRVAADKVASIKDAMDR